MSLAPIKQKYAELVGFFQWWVPEYLPNAGLYLQGQSSPRPANPYVSFNPLEDVEVVGIDERRISSNGDEALRGQRIITCSLGGYADSTSRFDGSDSAWDMLQELRFSLGYPEVRGQLSLINCRVLDEGTVTENSITQNTTNEPRANLSFTLSTVIVQDIDSGEISTINGSGNIISPNGSVSANFTATKP